MKPVHVLRLVFLALMFVGGWQWPAIAGVSAWFVPSTTKVLRDARPDPNGRCSDIAAARNETEACQLVLRAEERVAGVVVSVPPLRLTGHSASLTPTLFKVEYVPNIVGHAAYPDPLPPLKSLDLEASQAQPVWISVKVPKQAKAGDYAGTVQVEAGGHRLELPLRLHVWDFALPDTPIAARPPSDFRRSTLPCNMAFPLIRQRVGDFTRGITRCCSITAFPRTRFPPI